MSTTDYMSEGEMAREAIKKSVRFEVFKRDAFKCQYCGAAAPDVLLQIDHVRPVAKGGTNDILNLVTSCQACNAGKSDKLLEDGAAVTKARTQLEALQERREQLEMMMQWQEGLKEFREETVDRVAEYWYGLAPGFTLNDTGRQRLKKLVRDYSLEEIFEAMDIAAEQYLRLDDDGNVTRESWDNGYKKIGGICRVRKDEEKKPYLKDLLYARGTLRKRVYVDERYVMELMENAVFAGAEPSWIVRQAQTCRSWTNFRDSLHDLIDEANNDHL